MVLVKICGITSLHDAWAAVEAGADALGFVMAPSKRRVQLSVVRTICKEIPDNIMKIGVFVNSRSRRLLDMRAFCGLDAVQLHGDESEAMVAEIGSSVIKAVPVKRDTPLCWQSFPSATLLLDTYSPRQRGGTGQAFDWTRVQEAALARPIFLAGGLTAENVALAVDMVKPYAVDVSSGIERSPGRKDHDKLACFVRRAKGLE